MGDTVTVVTTGQRGLTGPQGPAGPAGAGSAWGGITGTLSDQADLQSVLTGKAPLASPTFTGTPTAPTAAPGTNTTQLASTAFVKAAVDAVTDATLPVSDVTTNNFSTTKHGFVPKGTNVGNYLKDDGTWAAVNGMAIGGVVTGASDDGVFFGGTGGILSQNATNFSWDDANTQLSLVAGGATKTPLRIEAAASQTANLCQVDFTDATTTGITGDGDIKLRGGSRFSSLYFDQSAGVGLRYHPLNGAVQIAKTALIVCGLNPFISFYSDNDLGNRAQLYSGTAGVLDLNNGAGGGAAMRFIEMTAPAAPAANSGVVFMQDNGSGKTQYCVRFPTGAIQVIATEP